MSFPIDSLKMELSEEVQNLLQKYKIQPQKLDTLGKDADDFSLDDIIDVSKIQFDDDENWLKRSEILTVKDLNKWLLHDSDSDSTTFSPLEYTLNNSPITKKTFDSRTYTRPKKKHTRPSIEKYNEDYFEAEKKKLDLSDEIDNYISLSKEEDIIFNNSSDKPVHFDLSQPVSDNFFDKILLNAPEIDSFTNMSPPSLVNSMCSSTFTTLMENSYIKNDPVLREIRDADYSHQILQDTEVPMFQSFTESCSSINSDAPENFVRKTLISLNGTLRNDFELNLDGDGFTDNNTGDINDIHTENIDPNITINKSQTLLNGTYRKSNPKSNNTFEKLADEKLNITFNQSSFNENLNNLDSKLFKTRDNLNGTFTKLPKGESGFKDNLNTSFPKVNLDQTFEKSGLNEIFLKTTDNKEQNNLNGTYRKIKNTEKRLPLRSNLDQFYDNLGDNKRDISSPNYHFKETIHLEEEPQFGGVRRLSEEIDDYLNEKMISACDSERIKMNNTLALAANSTDSLDRMSNVSNSSRGSTQMMMAEVDAIVKMQENSLRVMSTPKPAKSLTKLFENTCLSPIPNLNIKEHLSDSEISSEEYVTVRTSSSLKPDKPALERNVRSLSNLRNPKEYHNPRSVNTITSNLKTTTIPTFKGSYSNLKTLNSKLRSSSSNLKTINSNLKGSYTNLKPVNKNLPNITSKPIVPNTDIDPNVTHTLEGPGRQDVFKMPLPPKDSNPSANNSFVKQTRISSLPRPIGSATGIPRPTSKIPAPKQIRSSSARQLVRPNSKTNLNDGYY